MYGNSRPRIATICDQVVNKSGLHPFHQTAVVDASRHQAPSSKIADTEEPHHENRQLHERRHHQPSNSRPLNIPLSLPPLRKEILAMFSRQVLRAARVAAPQRAVTLRAAPVRSFAAATAADSQPPIAVFGLDGTYASALVCTNPPTYRCNILNWTVFGTAWPSIEAVTSPCRNNLSFEHERLTHLASISTLPPPNPPASIPPPRPSAP